jgi:ketosteroid isomerase-like protein
MNTEVNKATLRRFADAVWRNKDVSAIDDCFSDDYADEEIRRLAEIYPGAPAGMTPKEGLKWFFRMYFGLRPDFEVTGESLIAEGDQVVQIIRGRFSGEHEGKPSPMKMQEINVFTLRDGKIVGRFGIGNSRPDTTEPPRGMLVRALEELQKPT